MIWVRSWRFLEAAFLNGNAWWRANRACANVAPMLEQKKNKGKGASSSAGTPQFKVNVVTGTPLPKRSMRRDVDKHEPAKMGRQAPAGFG
jgi:hypothetical protein